MNMYETSKVTGKTYVIEDAVFFRNIHQSAFYVKHGAVIWDLFVDDEYKFVFCFPRKQHNKLIKLWMDNKHKNENNVGVNKDGD